jgi:hypothetical protein
MIPEQGVSNRFQMRLKCLKTGWKLEPGNDILNKLEMDKNP